MRKIPTVRFDTSRLTAEVLEDLENSIRELPEVSEGVFDDIYDLAVRTIAVGGDMHPMSVGLTSRIHTLSDQRASQIAVLLWARTKGRIDRERQLQAGLTHAYWMYSFAPCMLDAGSPTEEEIRRDAAHKAANEVIFPIAEGLLVLGHRTWPGRDLGCKCVSRARVPGFED